MKKIFLYIIFSCIVFTISATNLPLTTIKGNVLVLLKQTGDISEEYTIKNLPNKIIVDRRNNRSIQQGLNGIFYIPRFSAHGCAHYLLVDNKKTQIINMRGSFVNNLETLMAFFEENREYTKDDVLFYIADFISTYNINEKRVASEGVQLQE